MGDDRLNEIRARLDAATPGPWFIGWDGTRRFYFITANENTSGPRPWVTNLDGLVRSDRDADLIRHAPDDLAWLLDRVDALETELALSTESEVWAQVEAMRVRGKISSDGGERND